jgi:hypothetical protein
MGQNCITIVVPSLQCLRCKGIRKFIFFWLCIVSFVKKNNCEKLSSFSFFYWVFFKWSHCNGWPTRWKKIQRKGLIIMGDHPSKNNEEKGLIVMNDLPTKGSHCNGWPTKKKRRGLIVMGDLPKKGSHCNGWSIQVEKESLTEMTW